MFNKNDTLIFDSACLKSLGGLSVVKEKPLRPLCFVANLNSIHCNHGITQTCESRNLALKVDLTSVKKGKSAMPSAESLITIKKKWAEPWNCVTYWSQNYLSLASKERFLSLLLYAARPVRHEYHGASSIFGLIHHMHHTLLWCNWSWLLCWDSRAHLCRRASR